MKLFITKLFSSFSDSFMESFTEEYEMASGEPFDSELIPYIIGIYAVIMLFALAIGLVFYLLRAVGVYGMAKTAGQSKPWLAFIPIVNSFALGRLAEIKRQNKKPLRYSLILLWLNIPISAVTVALIPFLVALILTENSALALVLIALYPIILVLSVTYMVFYYITLYKTFKNFAPENATLFLILTILFNISEPIIIFCLRNKPVAPEFGFFGYNNFSYGYGSYYTPPVSGGPVNEEKSEEKSEKTTDTTNDGE
ncbi:MAG: hypothetical protein U0M06_07115 [Clostridia bacterium]|nr:hypothetical protein [Clostridia bacterium]